MVAIVGGNSLGLNLSSLANLGPLQTGGLATQGRQSDKTFVNAATGNLIIQAADTRLVGVGLDTTALRTYNSQGAFDFDNNDRWQGAIYKSIVAGPIGTLLRTDSDGSSSTYSLSGGVYISTIGLDSASDTISLVGGQYKWTDGASGRTETYQSSGSGLILSSSDARGNTLTYTYNGDLLTKVTNADGESVNYTYNSTNRTLLSISTTLSNNQTISQVSYDYDTQLRLKSVSC
jgi:hypothetical protein